MLPVAANLGCGLMLPVPCAFLTQAAMTDQDLETLLSNEGVQRLA